MARQEAIWKERKYEKRRKRIVGALTRSLDMFVVEHYPLWYRAVVMLDRRCEGTFIPRLLRVVVGSTNDRSAGSDQ